MSMNVNLTSMNNLNQLSKTIFNANLSMEKLSSGQKINKAGDDAAGLAISENMKALINGYDKGIRNAEDGASALQTADGALSSTEGALQRMRELAVESANGTLSDSDRKMLQNEYSSLKDEIDRVSGQSEFNGQKLLDGSFSDKVIHDGANTDENISVSLGDMSAASLSVDNLDLSTQSGANTAIGEIDKAIEQVSSERGNVGAMQNRLGYSVNNLQVSSLNTYASESRIRDLFTSREIMNQVKNNLLMQTNEAMMAQSNKNAYNTLFLLR